MSRAIALIPLRESDVVEEGRQIELAGRPLPWFTIEAARSSRHVSRVIVSTSSVAVRHLAQQLGAEVPFLRPAELDAESIPLTEVARHCLHEVEATGGDPVDAVILLEASHPLRPAGLIDSILETLFTRELDSVLPVVEERSRFWVLDDYGEMQPVGAEAGMTRQGRRPIYREVAGFGLATRTEFVRQGHRLGRRVGAVVIDRTWALADVREPHGIQVATALAAIAEPLHVATDSEPAHAKHRTSRPT